MCLTVPTNGKSLLPYLNIRNLFWLFVRLVISWSQLLIAVRSLFIFRCTRVSTNELKHHGASPCRHQLGVVSSILFFPVFNFMNMETSDCHFVQLYFTSGEKAEWSSGDVANFKRWGEVTSQWEEGAKCTDPIEALKASVFISHGVFTWWRWITECLSFPIPLLVKLEFPDPRECCEDIADELTRSQISQHQIAAEGQLTANAFITSWETEEDRIKMTKTKPILWIRVFHAALSIHLRTKPVENVWLGQKVEE